MLKRVIGFLCVVTFLTGSMHAAELYETQWNLILKKNVQFSTRKQVSSVLVNYEGIKDSQSFSCLLRTLSQFDVSTLKTDAAKKAFWINVYNIAVVKLVLEQYPAKTVHTPENDELWKRPVILISDKILTLQDIEFEKLGVFDDYRLPFVLSNATLSGPDLFEEAYSEATLDSQLTTQFKRFINNDTKGVELINETREAHFSVMLKRLADDDQGIVTKLQPYFPLDLKEYKVTYMYFNWNLNTK